jgi:hypothetical protein
VVLPAEARRTLQGVYLQYRQANAIRGQALAELLGAFRSARIECLALKGAALAHLVYPEPGLRTMRDLDLLVRRDDLALARGVLEALGYKVPPDSSQAAHYHHLPSASKRMEGVLVSVEVHYKLFPTTRYYQPVELDDLLAKAVSFQAGGQPALAPGAEDMLYHVYRHALGPPLLATPLRFIWLADLAGLVEQYAGQIDWERVRRRWPAIIRALPMVQALTPWPAEVLRQVPLRAVPPPHGLGQDYRGWPRSPGSAGNSGRPADTLWPAEWWLRLFYGADGSGGYWWNRLVRHPVHLLEWLVHFGLEEIRRPGAFTMD